MPGRHASRNDEHMRAAGHTANVRHKPTVAQTVTPGLTRGPASSFIGDMEKGGWVYIMADRYRGTLYVGVTASLAARVFQHRAGSGSDFCRRYGLDRLVWAERSERIEECIAHEKRLKKWRREWKISMIERANPDWADLFDRLV